MYPGYALASVEDQTEYGTTVGVVSSDKQTASTLQPVADGKVVYLGDYRKKTRNQRRRRMHTIEVSSLDPMGPRQYTESLDMTETSMDVRWFRQEGLGLDGGVPSEAAEQPRMQGAYTGGARMVSQRSILGSDAIPVGVGLCLIGAAGSALVLAVVGRAPGVRADVAALCFAGSLAVTVSSLTTWVRRGGKA
jgi:hypothetical protein